MSEVKNCCIRVIWRDASRSVVVIPESHRPLLTLDEARVEAQVHPRRPEPSPLERMRAKVQIPEDKP